MEVPSLGLFCIGFGNVGRALAKLLVEKEAALRAEHHVEFHFVGAITRRGGAWSGSVTPRAMMNSAWPAPGAALPDGAEAQEDATVESCLEGGGFEIALELSTLEPMSGEPALTHVRTALQARRHVVTANKGPIAYGLRELHEIIRGINATAMETYDGNAPLYVGLRYESTVMDGTPIFNMVRSCLPVTTISGFEGVLNSTSNLVLSRMAAGASLEVAIKAAQDLGIAEADPSADLDGWDAAVKVTVLANALLGLNLRPKDIVREGLGAEAMRAAVAAAPAGMVVKQLAGLERGPDGMRLRGFVRLVQVQAGTVWGVLAGAEAGLRLFTDTMGALTVLEAEGGAELTAMGVLADCLELTRLFIKPYYAYTMTDSEHVFDSVRDSYLM